MPAQTADGIHIITKGNPVMISTNAQATLVFEAGDLTVCLATLKDKEPAK